MSHNVSFATLSIFIEDDMEYLFATKAPQNANIKEYKGGGLWKTPQGKYKKVYKTY